MKVLIKMNTILIKKLRGCARIPFKSTPGSAGFDVCAAINEKILLTKNKTVRIPSGVSIAMPSNSYVAFLLPRSGLSINNGIVLANSIGIIDSDFRGEIIVGLRNFGNVDYTINPGDKIAQIVFLNIVDTKFKISDFTENDTSRGTGGLGSTGK